MNEKILKLKKSLREIQDDSNGYTVHVTKEDTGEESSMLLINVNLTGESESALIQQREKHAALAEQLRKIENEAIEIGVILPAILEKKDFSKEERGR